MVIMRRFKTNSACSSTTPSSRKSSSVSGLFKSVSSPTPPVSFNNKSTNEETGSIVTSTTITTSSSNSYQRNTVFSRYGRAINRSLHSGIGYVSGHYNSNNNSSTDNNNESTSLESQNNSVNASDGVGHCHLSVASSSSEAIQNANTSSKPPSSPKLPSRFKLSKNKVKSNSGSWYSTSKSCEHIKQGISCPGLLETTSSKNQNVPSSKETADHKHDQLDNKKSKIKINNSTVNKSNKNNRPMLIRQHSDEHQNALIEKVINESSKSSSQNKKDKTNKKAVASNSLSRTSVSKNTGKLRKMGALECLIPNDIVYEEGDNNKVVQYNDIQISCFLQIHLLTR